MSSILTLQSSINTSIVNQTQTHQNQLPSPPLTASSTNSGASSASACFPFFHSTNFLHPHHHQNHPASMPTMFPHSLIQQVTFAAAATTTASSASSSSSASSPQQQQIGQGIALATTITKTASGETKPSAAELLAQAQLDSVAVAALQLGGIGGGHCSASPQQMLNAASANVNNGREPKPFRCPQCPKAFANNSYLSQHMRIHLGLRAFGPCQYCGKKSSVGRRRWLKDLRKRRCWRINR